MDFTFNLVHEMMMKRKFGLLCLLCSTLFPLQAKEKPQAVSLAGEWQVRLDPDSSGVSRGYFRLENGQPIRLPGTLDEAGYGIPTEGSDYGILTRRYKYTGPAWYVRQIDVPREWADRELELYLERVMWQSEVWLDGERIDTQDGLGTPHTHRLGRLSAGSHTLAVRVNNDMIYNGTKGTATASIPRSSGTA